MKLVMKILWQLLMKNSQRSDTEKINLIEESKKIGIDEVIKHNEIIKKSLKSQK